MAGSIKHQAAMASSIKHQRIEHQSEIEVNPPIHLSTTPPPAPSDLIAFAAYCARVRVQKRVSVCVCSKVCVCVCVLAVLVFAAYHDIKHTYQRDPNQDS